MIRSARCGVNPSALDALHEDRVGDLKVQHVVHGDALLVEHLVEHLGLRDGAREPVEDEAVAAARVLDGLFDDADHDVVRDERPGFHGGLRADAVGGSGLDRGAQHVALCRVND